MEICTLDRLDLTSWEMEFLLFLLMDSINSHLCLICVALYHSLKQYKEVLQMKVVSFSCQLDVAVTSKNKLLKRARC